MSKHYLIPTGRLMFPSLESAHARPFDGATPRFAVSIPVEEVPEELARQIPGAVARARPKLPLTLHFQGIGMCYYRLGSFRCPDRGDFFVSGAEPFCYRASQHLTAEYWIATPTRKAVQRTIWVPGDMVKVPDLAPQAREITVQDALQSIVDDVRLMMTGKTSLLGKIERTALRAIAAMQKGG